MSGRGGEKDTLREAAVWVAESIGYPVQVTMPGHPMPQALWDALVDHIHADKFGTWHGNELARDEVESWLADESTRVTPPAPTHPEEADR